ncbi:MAG: hypothetical protein QGG69_08000 [Kiritimatiellia bacterium]|nr:hypothetical protein [Kiritimatiellia bacterium]
MIARLLRALAARFSGRSCGMSKNDHVQFWIDDSMRNITPHGAERPAGWEETAFLRELTGLLDFATVYELGCGYGRLCTAFRPDVYVGLDINPSAIERARKDHPEHSFRLIGFDGPYPEKDLCLAYTVLLHIDDRHIREVADQITRTATRVLVAEILGRCWRRRGKVPTFNRKREDYERLLSAFRLEMEIRKPYLRYADTDISFLYFEKNGVR